MQAPGKLDLVMYQGASWDYTFEGERSVRAEPGELQLGDFVEWDSSGGMARGRIEHIMTEGTLGIPDSSFSIEATPEDPAALIRIYRPDENDLGEVYWDETDILVGQRFSTLTKIDPLPAEPEDDFDDDEDLRQVDLSAPAYMRASARRGLEWHREGLSGDGVVDATIREAEAMSRGVITADKWVRLRAWISDRKSVV